MGSAGGISPQRASGSGALRPALDWPGRAWGEGGSQLYRLELYSDPLPGPWLFLGPWTKYPLHSLFPSLGGGTGAPSLPAVLLTQPRCTAGAVTSPYQMRK
ncbi:hypothetical protein ILYODFUR_038477 [Ilyodon furcidens]|uniref:Uncharacterized protein n=1 Tax=Ilyodon furcidens TaxID=33524 RepID=A0ABV0V9K8_9TELE